jgi:hypothetical protein
MPLHYTTHNSFKSHVKSPQADFLYSSVLIELTACLLVRVLLPLLLQLRNADHLYSRGTDMYYSKHMSRDHYPASPLVPAARIYSKHMSHNRYLLLCDATADTENTASIVPCWTVFTELFPVTR